MSQYPSMQQHPMRNRASTLGVGSSSSGNGGGAGRASLVGSRAMSAPGGEERGGDVGGGSLPPPVPTRPRPGSIMRKVGSTSSSSPKLASKLSSSPATRELPPPPPPPSSSASVVLPPPTPYAYADPANMSGSGGDVGGRSRSSTISTVREFSGAMKRQSHASTPIAPFLCNAIVSTDQRYIMKTNRACKVHVTTFTAKDLKGKDIFEVEGKLDFKKGKAMELQFHPKMSGVFFTPGIRGFPEGDRRVAHIVQKEKNKWRLYGYKAYYDDQPPHEMVAEVGERFLWGKITVSSSSKKSKKKKDTLHIDMAQPNPRAKKASAKPLFKERFQAKQSGDSEQWTVFPVTDAGIPEHASIASISPIFSSLFTGFDLDCLDIRTLQGKDASIALVAALLIGEIN